MARKKTPDYVRRANINYLSKFDTFALRLPRGYKDRATAAGLSLPDLVKVLQAYIDEHAGPAEPGTDEGTGGACDPGTEGGG